MSASLRIGIAGLGRAASMMLPAIRANPRMRVTAVTDVDANALESTARATGARACDDVRALAALDEVDVVYIATPTQLHAEHACAAAAQGKHVVVEKPMALDVAEAGKMIDAAEQHCVVLIVGHSRSFDAPIRRMRRIVAAGALGNARMIQSMVFTDWIYRPRRPDELDTDLGGGVIFRQGAHQFDVIRFLGGGMLASVRASVFDFDRSRSAVGAHAAFLTFADGTAATAVYNGYGALMTWDLTFGIGETGFVEPPESLGAARRAYQERGPGSELALKRKRAEIGDKPVPLRHPFFGLTLVSCEQGDLRQSPEGLYVYSAKGREEIRFPPDASAYDAVLEELLVALDSKRAPPHDGRWGMANLEVCEAALRSARTGAEQKLVHQVPVRD